MRTASFDIPATLETYLYEWLRIHGWRPRISIQEAEWDKRQSFEFLSLMHVGGEVEITYRPHGKRVPLHEQKWRRARDAGDQSQFVEWLSHITQAIVSEEQILASK